jgi:hypothetical protein
VHYYQREKMVITITKDFELVFTYIRAVGCCICRFDAAVMRKVIELKTSSSYINLILVSELEATRTQKKLLQRGEHA